jgi:rSAM/selenodomain-associated transferase 2
VIGPDRASPAPLGVVIPTLDEEEDLPLLLADLRALRLPTEIVIADGGSRDATLAIVERSELRIVRTMPGRARQMNAGALLLSTPWLLFLHADSRLPPSTIDALEAWLAKAPKDGAAYFGFRFAAKGSWWRIIEWGQRIRERLTGLAYGDQGLLLSRLRYDALGGIPDLPLMEDVEAVHRLRRTGGIARINAPILTSPRRYREEGPFLGWIRNAALISLYALGLPPRFLARWYRPRRWVEGAKVAAGPTP